jgi:hypothetical protein
MAKVGTSKAGGTMSQQAAVHPWLAADAHVNKQTESLYETEIFQFGDHEDCWVLGCDAV